MPTELAAWSLFLDGRTAYRPKSSVDIRLERDIHWFAPWEGVSDELHQLARRRA